MHAVILGDEIATERDFHQTLKAQLFHDAGYGWNLNSLLDVLTTDVPRPVTVVWRNAYLSYQALGAELFGRLVAVLALVASEDGQKTPNPNRPA